MHEPALILIGMPAVGKSTVGKRLAANLGRPFVDTDDLIVELTGRPLQETLDAKGYLELRKIEEQAILAADFAGTVVATGGSAVYSEAAMQHLAHFGKLVFLDASLEVLTARLGNFAQRGIASAPGDDLATIFADRRPRYLRATPYRIHVDGMNEDAVVNAILSLAEAP